MVVINRTLWVTAAAAAKATSGSQLGYTTRSIMPKLEKGPESALRAHSRTESRETPGMLAGRPMPIFINYPDASLIRRSQTRLVRSYCGTNQTLETKTCVTYLGLLLMRYY